MRERCTIDERVTYDAAVICKRHADEWLHRYKPKRCAACPMPLSSSAWRPCPEWMREQLHAHHGAFVHKRPCYEKALSAKKQQVSNNQPMEMAKENEQSNTPFTLDVSTTQGTAYRGFNAYAHTHNYSLCLSCTCSQTRMEEATRTYLWGKALQQSGLKRKADAVQQSEPTSHLRRISRRRNCRWLRCR